MTIEELSPERLIEKLKAELKVFLDIMVWVETKEDRFFSCLWLNDLLVYRLRSQSRSGMVTTTTHELNTLLAKHQQNLGIL